MTEPPCPSCGSTVHHYSECNGHTGFEAWTSIEIRDHYADPEDRRKERERDG